MITNVIIAILMFFNVSIGQVDNNPGKGISKDSTPARNIIITDITP